ncbi:MAG: HAD hydrolase-like protein [Alphaproteobacteria bacterium]|nr:HAD hydrolase-like protein [Alphaproteobacteria bacterium]
MKPITPIIGISKIIGAYDSVVCGYDGVLTKGKGISSEALKALKNMHDQGVSVIILSNSPLRVKDLVESLQDVSFDLNNLTAVVTAGELLHHKLKNNKKLGRRYYNLGGDSDKGIFAGLDYQKVSNIHDADFIFIGDADPLKGNVEDYNADLQAAAAIGLPLVCVGMDVATHRDGEICLSAGAVAEQYALLGGSVTTLGKPNQDVLAYVQECLPADVSKTLFIGDSFLSDMKAGAYMGAKMLLVSKGIHMHTLGEGYIPDVQKARQLALNYDVYPDYLISGLRW